jgi:hypothetical protein
MTMICRQIPKRRILRRRKRSHETPALRFNPTAWAKLLYLRDFGDSEVGGFGISAADDPLYVEDIQLVRQTCDLASVAFDDKAVADFFDGQVDLGRRPEQFGRIWVHTHPGSCAQPSGTDHDTFARVFGRTEWALMFILARGGETFARLRFHVGPGGDVDLPVHVDYSRPFAASDHAAWQEEYLAAVQVIEPPLFGQRLLSLPLGAAAATDPWDEELFGPWDGMLDEGRGFIDERDSLDVS